MSEEEVLSPAERRRRKILARGNSRLEKITGLQQKVSSDAGMVSLFLRTMTLSLLTLFLI